MSSKEQDQTVASGFPPPDSVPGPTERLREVRGETDEKPGEPKYGRAARGRAGTEDTVSMDDMTNTTEDRARSSGAAVESFTRKVGEEAYSRAQDEFARRGMAQKLQMAGGGARQLAVAGALGVCAAGAATAGLVLLWGRVLPKWAAPLATAGSLGAIAVPFAVLGRRQIGQFKDSFQS